MPHDDVKTWRTVEYIDAVCAANVVVLVGTAPNVAEAPLAKRLNEAKSVGVLESTSEWLPSSDVVDHAVSESRIDPRRQSLNPSIRPRPETVVPEHACYWNDSD